MAVQAVMPQLTKTTVDQRVTKEWLTIRGDDRLTRDRDRGNGRTASRDNDDRDNGHRDHRTTYVKLAFKELSFNLLARMKGRRP